MMLFFSIIDIKALFVNLDGNRGEDFEKEKKKNKVKEI